MADDGTRIDILLPTRWIKKQAAVPTEHAKIRSGVPSPSIFLKTRNIIEKKNAAIRENTTHMLYL